MIRSLLLKSLPFLIAIPIACAQEATRQLESYSEAGGALTLAVSDGSIVVRPYTPQIVETSFIPKGQTFDPKSHAVVLAPQALKTEIRETAVAIEYATPGLVVTIAKSPFRISYSYRGKAVISEKDGYGKATGGESLDFNLDGDEALYGAGARALGMNRRGYKLQLYNKAHYGYETHSELMNYTMPLVMSSKMYALHFDNPQIGWLDLDSGKNNTLTYQTIGGRKTYQIIVGDTWSELVGNYTLLTGRQPLPPRWAFGNFASRFGYHSEAQAKATVARYRADGIPLDAIIFDLYWFGKDIKGTMGNLAFRKEVFPDPKGMISDFRKQGVKTILVTEPFILTTSDRWQEAVKDKVLATDGHGQPYTYDFYFGHTGLIDIFDAGSRDWFWNIYQSFVKEGVAGWWGDLGEPEVHPSALQHVTGSADQVHNIYGHEWAKTLYEGYRKDFPNQRPFILMRSGYSGSQRFGLIPWSGDVNRSWGGLQSQPEIALQMGMQGLAYMHSDLGGFAFPNLDDELYTRWLQYGVFQPIFRPHAQEEVPSEPVYRDAPTEALAKQAVLLRYRLLPYNYTLAFENSRSGIPLMRPLFFEEPANASLRNVADTYLWGDAFLVSPVLQSGVTEKPVYFPVGSTWFDFCSGQKYQGGQTATVAVALDHIPVFVRAGAFVPMAEPMRNTEAYSTKRIDLHYWHDASVAAGSGELYDDDGKTPQAYEKGAYELVHFASHFDGKQLLVSLESERGAKRHASGRTVALSIHQVGAKPRQVSIEGRSVPFTWTAERQTLEVEVPWKAGASESVAIVFAE